MKKKLFSSISLIIGFLGYAQTEVYIKYDEAGNQRYRGTNANAKNASEKADTDTIKTLAGAGRVAQNSIAPLDSKAFWKQIRLYPVPVNNFLTVDWTDELDELISTVSLYQHSTIHWKFQQQNIPSLNKHLKINMSGYDWGVYVLHIKLKDGRVFTRNITKR